MMKPHWAGRIAKPVYVVGCMLVLAGCVAPVPDKPASPRSNAQPTASMMPEKSSAAPKQKIDQRQSRVDVTELVGRTGTELVSMVGAPALKWQRGNAALWQYSGHPCVFHVFLSGQGDDGRVERVVSRPRTGVSDDSCSAIQLAGS